MTTNKTSLVKTSSILYVTLLFAAFISTVSSDSNLIIPPSDTSKPHVGIIFINGAEIPVERYAPLSKAIQDALASQYSVFVGLPSFVINMPDPLTISGDVDTVIKELQDAGMSKDTPLFTAGHSLGGIVVQGYAKSNADKFKGQILMGAFLSRTNVQAKVGDKSPYPLSTLTIGGEVDGLARISRIAEAAVAAKKFTNKKDFPVVILEGLSHMQFASGVPPSNVKKNDLNPQITIDEAHAAIANAYKQYIQMKLQNKGDLEALVKHTDSLFIKPWEAAFELQGYYHIKEPCYCKELHCPQTDTCRGGSKWVSQVAQNMLAGLNSTQVVTVTDNFHRVYTVNPVHLPQINNKCTEAESTECHLDSITVTQNLYSTVDDLFDSGFQPITASQMRVKMMSRQSMWTAAGLPNVDFEFTDGPSRCGQINQAAIKWALNNAGQKTKDRYEKLGERLIIGEDEGPYNAGPLWIWTYLDYHQEDDDERVNSDGTKRKLIDLKSPMMKTPTDYYISAAAGYHYCKLLSPARMMEWMYTDSLYQNDSIKNEFNIQVE